MSRAPQVTDTFLAPSDQDDEVNHISHRFRGAGRQSARHRLLPRRRLAAAVATALVVAVAGATVAYAKLSTPAVQYRTAAVTYGTITQSLSMSGNLAPSSESNLDFGTSGQVSSVNASVGQTVTAGTTLATLDMTALQGSLTQAEANLSSASAKLSLDEAGPTAQSLTSAKNAVSAAQVTLTNDQTNLTDTQAQSQQSVTTAQSAVTGAQALVTSDQAPITQDQAAVPSDQQAATTDCNADPTSSTCSTDKQTLTTAQQKLATDQATLAHDQATLQSAQAALQAALLKARQSNDQASAQVASAQQQLSGAQSSLTALEQGTTPQQIQMDQASVTTAQVAVTNAQKQRSEATLVAPTDGQVVQVNLLAGQTVSGGSGAAASSTNGSTSSATHQIVIATHGAFQVTGSVSDSGVGVLAAGQTAEVTPAGASQALPAKVTAIALQGTVTSGVTTFPVTVDIGGTQPSLRAGTSATVLVVLNRVVNVLSVPTGAVHNGSSVQVLTNGKLETVSVQVGASDAFRTQILSGLTKGATVVLSVITSRVPTTSGTGAGLVGGGAGAGAGGRGGAGGGPGGSAAGG
jgi:multidrug efflux pump subunit AcrA (membrane-fusion protein)